MKYIILAGDGMADHPIPELGNKTPLEVAHIPNMDEIAAHGDAGMVRTIPNGMPAGSDVGYLSILGYDPRRTLTGRAPLEAAAMGITLKPEDVAIRCNLVTVRNGIMEDFSAGHIPSEESHAIIESLNRMLGNDRIHFYPGVSYRHILVFQNGPADVKCTPPHDITDKPIAGYLPKGDGADIFLRLMEASKSFLEKHDVNKRRIAGGHKPATQIWLWGQGRAPDLKKITERFNIKGSIISAVDIVRGVGRLAGLDIIEVPGATGFLDTNFQGKAEYALKALETNDLVMIHVEAPDEAGHMGDAKAKIKALEDFDKFTVGTVLKGVKKMKNVKILLMPDHGTTIASKTHVPDPVPFVIYPSKKPIFPVKAYNETAISPSPLFIDAGHTLIERFVKG